MHNEGRMAKNKKSANGWGEDTDGTDSVEPVIGSDEPQPAENLDDDRDALLHRIAELESEKRELLADQSRFATAAEAKALAAAEPGRFKIDLDGNPSWVVNAEGRGEAWDAYRAQVGLISTPKQPVITRVGDDVKLGRV